jgi:hypothetical protein
LGHDKPGAETLAALESLPGERQDEIARVILTLADRDASEQVVAEDLPSVLEGLAHTKRGEFASDAAVERAFRRFDE